MHVEYHPAIEHELREIIEYYNLCSQGLGFEFLNEFERPVLKVASMPTQWRIVENGIRRALMLRDLFSRFKKRRTSCNGC